MTKFDSLYGAQAPSFIFCFLKTDYSTVKMNCLLQKIYVMAVGDFFQTQKAEMTMIVGKTSRLVLPILRRVERGAEKNGEPA